MTKSKTLAVRPLQLEQDHDHVQRCGSQTPTRRARPCHMVLVTKFKILADRPQPNEQDVNNTNSNALVHENHVARLLF